MNKTYNNAFAYGHSEDHLLELFSKGGSIKGKQTYYHGDDPDFITLFKNAWRTGRYETVMKILFWVRDCRGGAGARQNFRVAIKWLADEYPGWVKANINLIPMYGRWDDLKVLYDTPCEEDALNLWSTAILSDNKNISPLAAKWAGRQDFKLRNYLKMTPKEFRKLLVKVTGNVTETYMCAGEWEKIDFSKVPSVAGSRYSGAFKKHQLERYAQWCQSLKTNGRLNASVLFPHDIIRMARKTEDNGVLVEKMFSELPDYIDNKESRAIALCDFSESMNIHVSGGVRAMDVSLGLGLYCGDRLGRDNPFWRRLIPFSTDAKLKSWHDQSVLKAIKEIPDHYVGSTNIESALNLLLNTARFMDIKNDKMINKLIILSDMQFDEATTNSDDHVIEKCLDEWEVNGYERPSIIYWNLYPYGNQQARCTSKNVAMVSGFSPAILKNILDDNCNPIQIMNNTIEKYNITIPHDNK